MTNFEISQSSPMMGVHLNVPSGQAHCFRINASPCTTEGPDGMLTFLGAVPADQRLGPNRLTFNHNGKPVLTLGAGCELKIKPGSFVELEHHVLRYSVDRVLTLEERA